MKQLIFLLFLPMYLTTEAQPKNGVPQQWHIAASLPPHTANNEALGVAGPVAGVHGSVLMVGGGANFPGAMPWMGGSKKYYDELFLFRKNRKGALEQCGTARLPFALAYSANCSTPKGVVCAGGENENGLSKKVLLLQCSESAEKVKNLFLPDLPMPLTNASIATDGRTVYLAGGEGGPAALDQFLCLDLEDTAAGWQSLPPLPQPVSHAVLLFEKSSNTIYLVGGRKKNTNGISTLYSTVFAFSIGGKSWQQKASLPYALSAGTGAAAGNGTLLLFGGDKGETFHKAETLIAAIGQEEDSARKAALNEEKIKVQAGHPGFSNSVLQYDISKNEWAAVGTIPFAVPVTTTAVLWKGQVLITSGEIKAGVRTPAILAAQLK